MRVSPAPAESPQHPMNIIEPLFVDAQTHGSMRDILAMPSGRTLDCMITNSTIALIEDGGYAEFSAYYGEKEALQPNYMTASIYTNDDGGGSHNTDLHAALLLRRAITYFDTVHSKPVGEFIGYWSNPDNIAGLSSDNYDQYMHALSSQSDREPHHQARAARTTWTGKQMAKLGFVWITSVDTSPDADVSVTFVRPAVLSPSVRAVSFLRKQKYMDQRKS